MALEDVVQAAMEAGVKRFILEDFGEVDGRTFWHWELLSAEPVKWFDLFAGPKDFWFEWFGFGWGDERPFGWVPFRIDYCKSLHVGVHVGCERAGWQGVYTDSLEEGLRHALRAYVCEFDIATCTHFDCPDRDVCDLVREDWDF